MQPVSFRSYLSAALLWAVAGVYLSACSAETQPPSSAEGAEAFVQRVETELSEISEYASRAAWELRARYQGITPPSPRPAGAFDPGAKFHIPASTPYARYFLAFIYEFQFYRAACRDAGWDGPLNRCSVYGNTEVGAKLNTLLETGQSRTWRETLAAFSGGNDIDASAIQDYFSLLNDWLTAQNEGRACGW